MNFHSQDDRARGIGSGLSDLDGGVRLGYQFSRKFATYIGYTHTGALGQTATFRRQAGQATGEHRFVFGIWLGHLSCVAVITREVPKPDGISKKHISLSRFCTDGRQPLPNRVTSELSVMQNVIRSSAPQYIYRTLRRQLRFSSKFLPAPWAISGRDTTASHKCSTFCSRGRIK